MISVRRRRTPAISRLFRNANKLTPPNPAKPGQIIYKHCGGHFMLYQKTTYEIKTKDHCESKKPAYNY